MLGELKKAPQESTVAPKSPAWVPAKRNDSLVVPPAFADITVPGQFSGELGFLIGEKVRTTAACSRLQNAPPIFLLIKSFPCIIPLERRSTHTTLPSS